MEQEQGNSKQEQKLLIELSMGDLAAIGYALFPYAQYIHRIVLPQRERGRILMIIERLRGRVATLQSHEGAVKIPLVGEELRVIDAALDIFLDGIDLFMPQSISRDELVQVCYTLRQHLRTMLPAEDSE